MSSLHHSVKFKSSSKWEILNPEISNISFNTTSYSAAHQNSSSHLCEHQKMTDTCFCLFFVFAMYHFIISMAEPKVFKEKSKCKSERTYVVQQGKCFCCSVIILTQSHNVNFLCTILAVLVLFHCDWHRFPSVIYT